ncbi:heme NO-binding domain-containing protein [Rufibacter soli]
MHGFIVLELEKFIMTQYGFTAWNAISKKANATNISIDGNQVYPDAMVFTLVTEAVEYIQMEPGTFLEQFGKALVPNLLKVYKAYIDPSWKTLDILENTENTMHHAVRTNNPNVTPPILEITRKSSKAMEIIYRSKRNIPQLGLGIIKGIAAYFGELPRLYITLTPCQEEGTYRFDVELSA